MADADYMEMVALEDGGYRFLLQGGVRISGNEVEITCSRMEVFLLSEDNSTTLVKFGKSSRSMRWICDPEATGLSLSCGSIELGRYQRGRLVGGIRKGDRRRVGNGDGEKIFLESGTAAKARIEKTDQVRPRLTLPEIQNFNLPFGKEASGDNQ